MPCIGYSEHTLSMCAGGGLTRERHLYGDAASFFITKRGHINNPHSYSKGQLGNKEQNQTPSGALCTNDLHILVRSSSPSRYIIGF